MALSKDRQRDFEHGEDGDDEEDAEHPRKGAGGLPAENRPKCKADRGDDEGPGEVAQRRTLR